MNTQEFNKQCLLHFGADIEETLKLVISARKLRKQNHKAYKKRLEKKKLKAPPSRRDESPKLVEDYSSEDLKSVAERVRKALTPPKQLEPICPPTPFHIYSDTDPDALSEDRH